MKRSLPDIFRRENEAAMDLVPVQSSNLAAVGYESNEGVLEVHFKNGAVYQYLNVPVLVHQGLMVASSKGGYLDRFVKKAGYRYVRVH
ncbi:KTSC domain-containing protein [Kitasatospora sp. NPDC004799]|uniref:KTSC domain-containing protein n=1 Tax=Kitasatospora sp. NPDC004799 TaxID=3154460 RepID=UPI00339DD180